MDPNEIIGHCESVIDSSGSETDNTALAAVCLVKALAIWLRDTYPQSEGS